MNPSDVPGESTRNFYRNQGAKQERERIIKLLEDSYLLGEAHPNYLAKLIALIKGENK